MIAIDPAVAPPPPSPEVPAPPTEHKPNFVANLANRCLRFIFRKPELNPMLFKEICQGVHNSTFIMTFFLLLTGGLAAMILGPLMIDEYNTRSSGPSGATVAGLLLGCLHLYGVAIALRTLAMTTKEFDNRTFELYALAGLSPERMVLGKISIQACTFLFGLSALAPFILSAYFLGGVDVLALFWVFVSVLVLNLHLFMVTGVVALSKAVPHLRGFLMLGFGVGLIFFIGTGLSMITWGLGSGRSTDILSMLLLGFQPGTWEMFWPISFHLLALITTFVVATHFLCPESDSREHWIKGLFLIVNLMMLAIMTVYTSDETIAFYSYTSYIGFLALGLLFYVNQEVVPVMVRNRARNSWYILRVLRIVLEPGRFGTAILLMFLMGLNTFVVLVIVPSGVFTVLSSFTYSMFHAVNQALTLPAWGVLTIVLSDRFTRTVPAWRNDPALRRTAICVSWALIALAYVIVNFSFHGNNVTNEKFTIIGALLSPVLMLIDDKALSALSKTPIVWLIGLIGSSIILILDARRVALTRSKQSALVGDDYYVANHAPAGVVAQ